MWFLPNINGVSGMHTGQTPAQRARQRIRTDRLEHDERAAVAEVFDVLETLVTADELPAEARSVYDNTVLLLGRERSRTAA